MVRIFNYIRFNTICFYCILITFPVASIALPLPVRQTNSENEMDEDAYLIVDRVVDKLLKLEKQGKINEMIDCMLDVKEEVESQLGHTIHLNDQLKEVRKLAKEEGKEIPKKQIDKFKTLIKKREKKRDKTVFGIRFRSKKSQEDEDDDKDEEVKLPVKMSFGVTMALCGFFIYCMPHPAAKKAGKYLIMLGVAHITESGLDKAKEYQEERKKERKRKKNELTFKTHSQKP